MSQLTALGVYHAMIHVLSLILLLAGRPALKLVDHETRRELERQQRNENDLHGEKGVHDLIFDKSFPMTSYKD